MSIAHNRYFDGNVQSLGFERNGHRATVGVLAPGTYEFGTDAPERMTIVFGEVSVRHPKGAGPWRDYAKNTSFEIPGKSGFDIKTGEPAAYLCEFL